MKETNTGFPPIYNQESQVLILGSFPSVISRNVGFYYGNKQNRFWKTLEKIFSTEIIDTIDFKTNFLLEHHLALYDVFEQSNLKGSADSNLLKANNTISDISFLLPPYTKISKIICNGKAAYKTLINNYDINIPIIYLSSTSSANPRYDYSSWKKELEFLK